jgi:predicted nucleotidyltransferase
MFAEILAELAARHIRVVVVGGVAATIHGSARLTNDLDLCYDTAAENVESLVALLREWGAYLRGVPAGLPFFMDARTFQTTPLLTLTTTVGELDLLDEVPGVGRYAAVLAASEPFEIDGVPFRALSLDALIDAKRAARRKKDLEHLIELEAIRALRDRTP